MTTFIVYYFRSPVFYILFTIILIFQGARVILKLLGYTEVVEDGVCFHDAVQAPDANTVAMVTADLILAKAEIEAYTKHYHPHPDRVKECVDGTVSSLSYPPTDISSNSNVYGTQSASNRQSTATQQQVGPRSEAQLQQPVAPRIPMSQPVVQKMRPRSSPIGQPLAQPMQATMGRQPMVVPTIQSNRQPLKPPYTDKKPPATAKPAWPQKSTPSVNYATATPSNGRVFSSCFLTFCPK